MANAGIGLGSFGSAFADAFFRSRQAKEDREMREKIIKAQTNLYEAQLREQERKEGALGELTSRMMPTTEVPDFSPLNPQSQNRFTVDMPGLPSGATQVPGGGNQFVEKPGIGLAEMIAGNDPELEALLLMTGTDPKDLLQEQRLSRGNEIQEAWLKQFGFGGDGESGGAPGLGDFRIESIEMGPDGQPRMKFGRDPEEVTPVGGALSNVNMDTLLQTSREAIELTPILEGTMMAQGSPFAKGVQNVQAGYNAILNATGITDEERTQQLFAYDRINKLYGLIENTRIERANNLSGGRGVTDAARAQIQRISPSHDKQWSANRLLIADFLEEELATLKARGVPMLPGQVQKIEETIGRLRTEETGSSPMIDLEAIATATIDEIAELIDKTDPSDTKTWAAIKRRFDELTSAD